MDDIDGPFAALVASRWAALVRTAFLLTGDRAAAEDLVQASLTKAYVHWRRIREPAAAEAYVRRTMFTTYTSWWRRHRRESLAAEPPEPRADDRSGDLEAVLARSTLWPHLARLPRGQRAVLVLRFYEDLTEVQTAKVLGCSVGTVKSQTSRALATLRKSVEPPVTSSVVAGREQP